MQEIAFTPSIPAARLGVTFGLTQVIVDYRWNSEEQAWYFDLREIDERPILRSAKLVLGTLIGRWSSHPLFQAGTIMLRDLSRQQKEATYDDLGVRVKAFYVTDSELALAGDVIPERTGGEL